MTDDNVIPFPVPPPDEAFASSGNPVTWDTQSPSGQLRWVRENMPLVSAVALQNFIMVNPSWNGAGWDDCLDMLLDSDSHLELTEPLYEQAEDEEVERLELVSPIAITLLWSHRFDREVVTLDEVRSVLVRANA